MNHINTKLSRPVNCKPLFMLLVSLILAIVTGYLLQFNHFQINLTPSMPLGLYRVIQKASIQRSDIVVVCLPHQIAQEGLQQGYLTQGKCPSGTIAVVKEVIATPGDTINLTQEGIRVNNQFYLAPQRLVDSHGLLIKRFVEYGVYSNINDYWLYGSHSPEDSWDSRYFGSIHRENIKHVMEPIFLFN